MSHPPSKNSRCNSSLSLNYSPLDVARVTTFDHISDVSCTRVTNPGRQRVRNNFGLNKSISKKNSFDECR